MTQIRTVITQNHPKEPSAEGVKVDEVAAFKGHYYGNVRGNELLN